MAHAIDGFFVFRLAPAERQFVTKICTSENRLSISIFENRFCWSASAITIF